MLDIFVSGGEDVDAGDSRSRYLNGGLTLNMQIHKTQMKRHTHVLVRRGVPTV